MKTTTIELSKNVSLQIEHEDNVVPELGGHNTTIEINYKEVKPKFELKEGADFEYFLGFSTQETKELFYRSLRNDAPNYVRAQAKLELIVNVINANCESDGKWWQPYYEKCNPVVSGGFGFVGTNYGCTNAHSGVGSRLWLCSKVAATYFGNNSNITEIARVAMTSKD